MDCDLSIPCSECGAPAGQACDFFCTRNPDAFDDGPDPAGAFDGEPVPPGW